MGFRTRQLFQAATNVFNFLLVMTLAIVLGVKPQPALHQGFFCDDVTIRYPYNKDTISVYVVTVTCLLPALVLVVGLELAYGLALTTSVNYAVREAGATSTTTTETAESRSAKPGRDRVKRAVGRAGILVACLIHGNGLCFVLTEVFKLSFGRLRPYFLSVCQPDPDVTSFSNCSGLYIEDITCLNSDKAALMDIRKSFLSGHASFSAFNMLFICFYLQLRLPKSTPRLLVSMLQGVALGYGVFVCATRLYDHAHHPLDVFGGVCLGLLCVSVTVFKICPGFVRRPPRKEGAPTSQEEPSSVTRPNAKIGQIQ